MDKDFNSWNISKQLLDQKETDIFYHAREVWWCSVGINIGHETDGKNNYFERPVLVVKVFNRQLFWGVPLTSKIKVNNFHVLINVGDSKSSAMITQFRLLSSKRLLRKMNMISSKDLIAVKNVIIDFLK